MRDDEKQKLHENVKQEIRSLLISSPKTKYGGLTGSLLYFDYKQLNCGKEVPYAELGFHSFLALLRSMPDVVRIEYKENSISYRVHPVYDQSTAHIQKMVFEQRDKYELQNRSHIQNWYSNNRIPMNYGQFSFIENYLPYYAHNSFGNHSKFNNSSLRPFPKQRLVPIKQRIKRDLEPYLLLTPVTPTDHSKQNERINLLSGLSPKFIDHNETCSSLNTFLDTPSNDDLDDDHFNESNEKVIFNQNVFKVISKTNSPINDQIKQIEDEVKIISNSLKSSPVNEQITNNPDSHVQEQSDNEDLIKRINQAIRQCIHFRYIHRLRKIEFEYRHYPLSDEIKSIKYDIEKLAYIEYEQELSDFEKVCQSINDEKCQIMFDQYISLQRNYYYMNKIINKNKKRKIR